MATPNMFLDLPVVSVTLGPEWATELNAALEVIDAHDHTSGKGLPITQAAFSITDDFDLQNQRAINVLALRLVDQTAAEISAGNEGTVQEVLGDLYWVNGAGVAVQITDGSEVITPAASLEKTEYATVAVDTIIGASATTVALGVDVTAGPRTITLPLASAVEVGRFYIISDLNGLSETNNLTIQAAGSDTIDGASTALVNSNFGARFVQTDGISKWKSI